MSGRALYLVWRPRRFDDVVGQQHVVRTIRNAVKNGTIAHAYLFSGPRGTGKTVDGAAAVQGRQLPRTRIDGASLRSVRHLHVRQRGPSDGPHRDGRGLQPRHRRCARSAREDQLRPGRGPLPGVHPGRGAPADPGGLGRAAQDAGGAAAARHPGARHHRVAQGAGDRALAVPALRLPPPHGGRTSAIGWRSSPRTKASSVEGAVLSWLARAARGGMRDAISLLDQLRSFCGDHIDAESAREVLGLAGLETIAPVPRSAARGPPRRSPWKS